MLIRKEQLNRIAETYDGPFIQRMVDHIVNDLAVEYERQAPGHKKEDLVIRQIRIAREYGIVNADDLKAYIDCAVIFGPEFDRDPRRLWAAWILRRQDLLGTTKAEVLHAHLVFNS